MSTNGRENQYFPRIFKGLQERTGHHKKRTLPRALADVSEFSCVTGNLDQKAQNIHILVRDY